MPHQSIPEGIVPGGNRVTIHYLRYVTGLSKVVAASMGAQLGAHLAPVWRHWGSAAANFGYYLFRNLFGRKKFHTNLHVRCLVQRPPGLE